MRTRCERCKAEYEIDDSRVQGSRAGVQCTVCGNVFAVAQTAANGNRPAPSATSAEKTSENGGWFLQTADGKVHRFRALASLPKWIIARKVARQDRVSSDGHLWQQLGDIAELAPYFDGMDQDEQARAVGGSTLEQAAGVDLGRRPPPTRPARRPSSGDALPVSVPNDARSSDPYLPVDDGETGRFPPHARSRGALKVLVGLIVAAGVAFVGIRLQEDRDARWRQGRVAMAAPGPRAAANRRAPVDRRRPSADPAEAPADVAAGSEAEPASAPSPSSKGPVVEALPSPPPPAAPAAETRKPAAPAGARPESFEKLVAEADRALENGSNAKARDLYQKALRLRPRGAKALAGLGFVALDRSQIPVAYEYFKRALAAKTSFPPAVFGMAEIHRARHEKSLAVQSYQRYLQVAPNGHEAVAARRQLKALQGR
jgi:predicted Zn finger-like uncharacterized protein